MELKLLSVALFLAVVLASAKAAITPEQYWKTVLPKTPMPKAIQDILYLPYTAREADTAEDARSGDGPNSATGLGGTSVGVGRGGVSTSTGNRRGTTANGGVGVGVGVGGTPGLAPFDYSYAASETQLHDDSNVALFFLEKDLKPRKTMTLHFTKSSNRAAFLPREVADKIPFSTKSLPEIYDMYSVRPDSAEAEMMKNTIRECEAPGIEGEEKYCTTSLESMIDFCKTKLGKDIKSISTEVSRRTLKQKYTVTEGSRRVVAARSVVCHKENYPYAVFYCHKMQDTRFYMVPMKGLDGTAVEAVVACHSDTSKWNPKHLAFQVLKVEPGTVPICHFLPEDHVVWLSN